jgi:membrane protease YdiL (CAAX protease family)
VLVASQVVDSGILLAIAVGLGLLAAQRVGLRAPFIEAWLARAPVRPALRELRLPITVALGLGVAIVIIALDRLVFRAATGELAGAGVAPPARWQGVLASFSRRIHEELLIRLGVMSLLAWLLARGPRRADGTPGSRAFWLAIVGSATVFGLAHLPLTAPLASPLVVTRAVVLNGIAGMLFGWLYWRRGLEAAMAAHWSADVIVHGLLGS